MPDVIIISTGNELLNGTTCDTNSAFISRKLSENNFNVIGHITVGDDLDSIKEAVTGSISKAEIIITTGGLGPTDDDKTVEAIASITGNSIIVDEESERKFRDFLNSSKIDQNVLDYRMSAIPGNSKVIDNPTGFAPGFIVKYHDKSIISLPGVPGEAEPMFASFVMPYLLENFSFTESLRLSYRLTSIRESEINSRVNNLNLHESVFTGITSRFGICELTLTGFKSSTEIMENTDIEIRKCFSPFLIRHGAETPQEEAVILLRESGLKLSTAESCTGGLIAKKITDIPGSSDVYTGSIIAYSNDIKKTFLDVSDNTLTLHGAVSEKTAMEMAVSARLKFRTDISVSTTGIAGPGGGTKTKPVGTVCFAVSTSSFSQTFTRIFSGNRKRVREYSALFAINLIRDCFNRDISEFLYK